MSRVYYNEYDAFAAAWLRNLMQAGLIPEGDVDERSIIDVRADDLRAYRQCHFFAGIGGWSHALRLAGWADDREIWTGSCPCQPFSVAGKGKGKSDERHLWPVFFELIRNVRPSVVMGEQVAGKAGYDWFDGVRSDLEGEDYSARAVDIPACAVNAPHIRQRLYWCAVADAIGREPRAQRGYDGEMQSVPHSEWETNCPALSWRGSCGDMAHTECNGRQGSWPLGEPLHSAQGGVGEANQSVDAGARNGDAYDMADANSQSIRGGLSAKAAGAPGDDEGEAWQRQRVWADAGADSDNYWREHEWLTGADGKTRRAKPGVRLLVDGVPNRVGRLRGYGNAIVPPLAAEVIKAFMEVMP